MDPRRGLTEDGGRETGDEGRKTGDERRGTKDGGRKTGDEELPEMEKPSGTPGAFRRRGLEGVILFVCNGFPIQRDIQALFDSPGHTSLYCFSFNTFCPRRLAQPSQ